MARLRAPAAGQCLVRLTRDLRNRSHPTAGAAGRHLPAGTRFISHSKVQPPGVQDVAVYGPVTASGLGIRWPGSADGESPTALLVRSRRIDSRSAAPRLRSRGKPRVRTAIASPTATAPDPPVDDRERSKQGDRSNGPLISHMRSGHHGGPQMPCAPDPAIAKAAARPPHRTCSIR